MNRLHGNTTKGLSGFFSLFGWFGSKDQRNLTNQINQRN